MGDCYCCKDQTRPSIPNTQKLRYDQDSFFGRIMELFQLTNPLYLLYLPQKFRDARCVITRIECDGVRPNCITDKQIWKARSLYNTTYDNYGHRIQILARPLYYIPFKMLIFYAMITQYKHIIPLVTFQLVNQIFNINFIRNQRNLPVEPSKRQLYASFIIGSLASAGTAVALHKYLKRQCASKLALSLVPFAAVAAGHLASTPFLRAQELSQGKPVFDCCGAKLGLSKNAAHQSVDLDIFSKIFKVAPPLLITPYALRYLKNNGTFCRYPWLKYPAPLGILFACMAFVSPVMGACFRQRSNFAFEHLEHSLRCRAGRLIYKGKTPGYVCYCAGPPLPY